MLEKLLGRNRLARAIADDDLELLLKAIRAGDPLDQPVSLDEQNLLPLDHCLRLLRIDLVQKLLQAGAPLPDNPAEQAQLLNQAITAGPAALELTSLLLQAGLNPNATDGQPLFDCLELPDSNQVNLLLNRLVQYGGELNSHHREQQSLLETVMLQPRELIEKQLLIGMLIQAGANLPDQLDQLNCEKEVKHFAQRQAQDLAIRAQFSGLPLN